MVLILIFEMIVRMTNGYIDGLILSSTVYQLAVGHSVYDFNKNANKKILASIFEIPYTGSRK